MRSSVSLYQAAVLFSLLHLAHGRLMPRGFGGGIELSSHLGKLPLLAHDETALVSVSHHASSSAGPSRPYPSDALPPLNHLEMPRLNHPQAPLLQKLMLDPANHEVVHGKAGHIFNTYSVDASRRAEQLTAEHTAVSGAKLKPQLKAQRLDELQKHIANAKDDAKYYRQVSTDHVKQSFLLRKPRPVEGSYRGVDLPEMSAAKEAHYRTLRAAGDPVAVHSHLADMSKQSRDLLGRDVHILRSTMRSETNPFLNIDNQARLAGLHARVQRHDALYTQHQTALNELRAGRQTP